MCCENHRRRCPPTSRNYCAETVLKCPPRLAPDSKGLRSKAVLKCPQNCVKVSPDFTRGTAQRIAHKPFYQIIGFGLYESLKGIRTYIDGFWSKPTSFSCLASGLTKSRCALAIGHPCFDEALRPSRTLLQGVGAHHAQMLTHPARGSAPAFRALEPRTLLPFFRAQARDGSESRSAPRRGS